MFDVAYFIAKEKLAFTKMKPMRELQERHGVDLALGTPMIMLVLPSTFVKYIAEEQQRSLLQTLSRVKFFSVQADSSTDAGNIEDELYAVQYFDARMDEDQVHVRNVFVCCKASKKR